MYNIYIFYQLHAVFRTQQGKHREPCVKTHRSPLSVLFLVLGPLRVEWRNPTQLFASTPERRNENINLNKYFISSNGDRTHNQSIYSHTSFMDLIHKGQDDLFKFLHFEAKRSLVSSLNT